ncbi:Na(+)-translocating NADH-quinone reductase subunit F [Desulfamplus magnetovallimortis]|uniref:Na(+)-translocating NADH-quinone reductase subunit F n=1 Tax=Desulfamplus magnetovallimortis TaxID=1246637 RepID=A0A1W1H626_9BACT|nr:NADH:ubiquinone reductase (Na(+)-transporting) subunit F [Desulfamplus magnetovallimortis]SLM27818.1 Na(+)-translocating NADH-quinone reductase subunit F [Desulfamplus magnetovallimortis]
MIYIISLAVFSVVIFLLVGMLLLVEARVATTGEKSVIINGDSTKSLKISGTPSLLAALGNNNIFLPSACGGSGSCGMCKCVVTSGGGAILPTELAHLTPGDKQIGKRLSCQLKVKNDLEIKVPESIFGITKFGAVVVSNNNISTYIKELVLKPDEPVAFRAGCYIQIDVPEYECCFKDFCIDSRFVSEWKKYNLMELTSSGISPGFRAYSLANPPHEKDVLKMTVKIATPPPGTLGIPPGFGSSYVFGLTPGDRVTVSGPYGDFFVKESEREKCFVGGGAGIAPLRSHVLDQLEGAKSNKRITFWYGARSIKDICYLDTFRRLEKSYPNFSYYVALSRPEPEDGEWDGFVGYVQNYLAENYLKEHDDPTEIEFYLCGPPMMVDGIVETLDSFGVDENMIFYDKF